LVWTLNKQPEPSVHPIVTLGLPPLGKVQL
jgi:hypothetical protein